jgi:hypothetical protein
VGFVFYPGQGKDGYGRKISSRYIAKVDGKWYRVYLTQISNAGSFWVVVRKVKYHLHDSAFSGVAV